MLVLGDMQKVEDACQEIFIKVWQRLHFVEAEEVEATADNAQPLDPKVVDAEVRDLEKAIQRLLARIALL